MILDKQKKFKEAANYLREAQELYEYQAMSSYAKKLDKTIQRIERKNNFFKRLSTFLLSN